MNYELLARGANEVNSPPVEGWTKQPRSVVELLSPAGDAEKLNMALAYGADAVYMAGKRFGLRSRAGNFEADELAATVARVHALGKRAYLTLNTVARDYELEDVAESALVALHARFDGVIVSDLGVMETVLKNARTLPVHVSTQAGVANGATAELLHRMGASRVILARELSLSELASIRRRVSKELELEVFVHGAMCVSFSGRCLLSNYMTGRDGNRGECAQPCRWSYSVVEEQTPGVYWPVEQHEEGTYIFNARDLCAIRFLDKIIDAGASSLKIEGRSKSFYYAALATRAYRRALDDLVAGRPFDERNYEDLLKVSHRPYSDGWFFGEPQQHYLESQYIRDWQVLAVVEAVDGEWATVSVKSPFNAGEPLELVSPNCVDRVVSIDEIYELTTGGDVRVDRAAKNQARYRVRLDGVTVGAMLHKAVT